MIRRYEKNRDGVFLLLRHQGNDRRFRKGEIGVPGPDGVDNRSARPRDSRPFSVQASDVSPLALPLSLVGESRCQVSEIFEVLIVTPEKLGPPFKSRPNQMTQLGY